MESFAVALASARLGVPRTVVLRAVSNPVGAPRGTWTIDRALSSLRAALPRVVAAATA
jgi:hypothetical protein